VDHRHRDRPAHQHRGQQQGKADRFMAAGAATVAGLHSVAHQLRKRRAWACGRCHPVHHPRHAEIAEQADGADRPYQAHARRAEGDEQDRKEQAQQAEHGAEHAGRQIDGKGFRWCWRRHRLAGRHNCQGRPRRRHRARHGVEDGLFDRLRCHRGLQLSGLCPLPAAPNFALP
jgi:hypothetical protein